MGAVLTERATERTRAARGSRTRAGAGTATRASGRPKRVADLVADRTGASRTATVPAPRRAGGLAPPTPQRRASGGTTRATPRRAAARGSAARAERAAAAGRSRYVLVMMVLLGTGLVATLWLSTAAAADSYRLDEARTKAREMAEQSERLHREVASLASPTSLAERAGQLGMVPVQDSARLVVEPSGEVEVVGTPEAATVPVPVAPPVAPARHGGRAAGSCPAPADEGNTASTCEEAAGAGTTEDTGTDTTENSTENSTEATSEDTGEDTAQGTADAAADDTGATGGNADTPITPGAVPFTGPRSPGGTAPTPATTATTGATGSAPSGAGPGTSNAPNITGPAGAGAGAPVPGAG